MAPGTPGPPARRVVTGVGSDGRSTIVADDTPAARIIRPGGATITEIWRANRLPADLDEEGPLAAVRVDAAAATGLAVRVCTFPPDQAMDQATFRRYAESVAGSYGVEPDNAGSPLHRTDTVDVVTVIQGELTLVTEAGETVLGQGESVVQRGTAHAWANRAGDVAVVLAVMIGADSQTELST